ncbi:MAG: NF038122 family metalloprotease [Betaproteobacteria bacterium]|nr:NF038122 family metalloprotease [Betaproteobacteria bacterium]
MRSSLILGALTTAALGLGAPRAADALNFNLSYDPSVSSAPAGFVPAFQSATQFYATHFSDPITVNLQVGWGEVANAPLGSNVLGESATNAQGPYTFGQVKAALSADAKTASDATALAHLVNPAADSAFAVATAQEKALSLLPGNASGSDGAVGFGSGVNWNFANTTPAPSQFDFVAVAEHEISQVMGRYSLWGMCTNCYSVLDLFRTGAGGTNFSIDGGSTVINTFNTNPAGDLGDWAGLTPDAYNAFATAGVKLPVSPGDLTALDVIGYDPAPVPLPSAMGLLASGLVVLAGFAHRRRGLRMP